MPRAPLPVTRALPAQPCPTGLASLEARVCLVADITEIDGDRACVTIASLEPMQSLALPIPHATWNQTPARFGEAVRDREMIPPIHTHRG